MDDKWVRNIKESPATGIASQLVELLGQLEIPDESLASDAAKVRRQADRIQWLLTNCDPYLVPQTALDAAQTHLAAAVTAVAEYPTAQDPAQIAAAMTYTEATLLDLSSLAIPAESVAPAEAIANIRQAVSDQLEGASAQMTNEVVALQAKVAEVEQQRAAAEDRNADLTAKLQQLAAEVETLRTSTATLTTQWQAHFTDEQNTRAEQFRNLLEEQRSTGAATLEGLDTDSRTSINKAEEHVASALSAIEEQKSLAEEIVGIISDEALIGEPSKRAAEDKRAAFWWSVGALVFGTVAAVIAVVAIFEHASSDNDADWVGFGLRALSVLAVGGLGAYAARQASEHRRSQRELDHLAVQLAAIKPYLRDMDEAKRDEVLTNVASKLFGPRLADSQQANELDLPPGTAQLVQALVKALQST